LSFVTRFWNPVQLHAARALAPPLAAALASPMISLRNLGMATTFEPALPRNWSCTWRALSTWPMLPSWSSAFAFDARSRGLGG
jgi:hypothetical protein